MTIKSSENVAELWNGHLKARSQGKKQYLTENYRSKNLPEDKTLILVLIIFKQIDGKYEGTPGKPFLSQHDRPHARDQREEQTGRSHREQL